MSIFIQYCLLLFTFLSFLFCQTHHIPNSFSLPMNALFSEFHDFNSANNKIISASRFNVRYNYHGILNNGHSNIDNYAELYAPGTYSRLVSTRFSYANSWLIIELEPYQRFNSGLFSTLDASLGTYQFNNNHGVGMKTNQIDMGFRQSQVILHFNGIGIGYGRLSHWWGPGFHSSLALSSNAPSQKTYTLGTFKDLRIGKFSFGTQIITMPYKSSSGTQLYFSGLKARMVFHSNPIITVQLHRTYLSGDFSNLSSKTNFKGSWTMEDATKLVIEPLFGQSKRNLDYTIPGTPGFDPWDELLSGFIELSFPREDLNVYLEIGSDDSRGNFTDLLSHWDHTLGFLIGGKKYYLIGDYKYFLGVEYLSTKISNTYNPKFYRGDPNGSIYYAYEAYDYFTYKGRRMGAHSGSSSDDLIFILGTGNPKFISYLSYNKERHGIKSMIYPELKTELNFTYHRKITKHHSAFITLEYEHIRNFGFVKNKISESTFLWFGYSFSLR